MTREEFCAKFAEAAKGLSVRAVARLLDASASSTSRWIKGTGAPARSSREHILKQLVDKRAAGETGKKVERLPPIDYGRRPSSRPAPPTLRSGSPASGSRR